MPKRFCLLLVLFGFLPPAHAQAPTAALAASTLHISPSHCVWRVGDNPAWARPNLDESGWKPYTAWKAFPSQPSVWLRCRADLSAPRETASPAIQVDGLAAYRVFLNGRQIGSGGSVHTGALNMEGTAIFPLPKAGLTSAPSLIALHMVYKWSPLTLESRGVPSISAGDALVLRRRVNSDRLRQIVRQLPVEICYGVIVVVAFLLTGLYLSDRSRLELLFLAGVCFLAAVLRLEEFFALFPWHFSSGLYYGLDAAGQAVGVFYLLFIFRLAHRPMPWFYRVVMLATCIFSVEILVVLFLPPAVALPVGEAFRRYSWFPIAAVWFATTAPFFAFWPLRRIAPRMRPVVICCMLWSLAVMVWITIAFLSSLGISAAQQFFSSNSPEGLILIRGVAIMLVLVTLLVLLFRDQHRTAEERALLTGEMQAAREIQQRLVPVDFPAVPGCRVAAVYLPAAEVGGDFYQVLPQPDGSTLIVVGDVSGKGLKAAMTGTLAIGALRTIATEHHSPAALLQKLNHQLVRAQEGGFITCLCAHITPNGTLTVANAGHLSPYRNGEEVPLESGLPLGITEAAEYTQTTVQLAPGDSLTFLSDGVIEARNPSGELFGFDRTQAISRQSAEEIANAAQQFGQEDDITVLTLALTPTTAEAILA